jgi:anaerobic selenocysteine-containing dehydrogenase/Fe-S-cluster-containing dehydrogenase component
MLRRDFLKLAAAAVGGLGAAMTQADRLIPFLNAEDQITPGIANWYATTCRQCPAGCGMLVRNREARATKAEGNPRHPINAGRLCARGQAALQELYDPDRLQHPLHRIRGGADKPTSWTEALAAIGAALASSHGKVAVISDLETGSLATLIHQWLGVFGSDRYLVYEPFNYESLRTANQSTFGKAAIPDYHLDKCDLILSLAADFVETWISPVKFIRRFADTRAPKDNKMSKFVYVGPRISLTGMNADDILLVAPGQERLVALSMLQVMAREGLAKRQVANVASLADYAPERVASILKIKPEKLVSLARQFAHAATPLALAGLPVAAGKSATETALAANLLNTAAGTSAIDFSRTHTLSETATSSDIAGFMKALDGGAISTLLIIRANPVYSLSPDYHFKDALQKVKTVISLTSVPDETAQLADWVLPIDNSLESWGDYEPETGITGILQPVMGRIYDTRGIGDILLALAKSAGVDTAGTFKADNYYDYLQQRWAQSGAPWQQSVQQGGIWNTAPTATTPIAATGAKVAFAPPASAPDLSLWLYPSTLLHDGRHANQRWLQEIPDVVTHAVWESWVEINPQTAQSLKLASGQSLKIATSSGRVMTSAFYYVGVHPQVLAIPFGQGHTAFGQYAKDRGVNAFQLLSAHTASNEVFPMPKTTLGPVTGKSILTTDATTSQHDRNIAPVLMLSHLAQTKPAPMIWPLPSGYSPETDLYQAHEHVGHRWAMAIDMSRCVGCEACVAACYAENNIAVVGQKWVAQGREMAWIRIDRYLDWDTAFTPARFLVMMCQHCDAAPCEPVCPVFAAAHDDEGLNQQVYNRCIGTRYCSNNCPYKVRRFNWRNYEWPEPLTWQLNPDVTVRGRGVMEKCTFCVQRIRDAEHRARVEGRPVRDGDIIPACAQTCPADVFVFGDLMDPNSKISQLVKDHPRRFQSLQDLNTKPAVFYLRKVINDRESM